MLGPASRFFDTRRSSQYEVRPGDDGETIRFAYPSAVEAQDYVRSDILLEFGGRNVIDPNEQYEIVPDDDQVVGLRSDYEAMRNGGMLGDGAMDFDELMELIRTLEVEVNHLC